MKFTSKANIKHWMNFYTLICITQIQFLVLSIINNMKCLSDWSNVELPKLYFAANDNTRITALIN